MDQDHPQDQSPDEVSPTHSPTITPKVAAHVLWHYGERGPTTAGMEPGSFIRELLGAFAVADAQNQARLAAGFPSYYLAMRLANAAGLQALREVAAQLRTPEPSPDPIDHLQGLPAEAAVVATVLAVETGENVDDAHSLAWAIVSALSEHRARTGPTWLAQHFIPRVPVTVIAGGIDELLETMTTNMVASMELIRGQLRGWAADPGAPVRPLLSTLLSPHQLDAVHDVLERHGMTYDDRLVRELLDDLDAARSIHTPGSPS